VLLATKNKGDFFLHLHILLLHLINMKMTVLS